MELMTILLSLFGLMLPAYVLTFLFPKGKYSFGERLIIALGLIFVYVPLLTLYSTYAGVGLSKWLIMALIVISGIVIIYNHRVGLRGFRWKQLAKLNGHYVLLAFILMVSILVRLVPVWDFIVPSGSDSCTHAVVSQLIVERGGVPHSYQPYTSYVTFSYHFGFHSVISVLYLLSRIEITRLITIVSQLISAFALLSVFLFVGRLTKNKNMALLSAFIVGLVSIFPAYLVNWGRFTQLSGFFMLPIVLILIIESMQEEKCSLTFLSIASLSLAGLFLTHVRVFVMGSVFLFCFLLVNAWGRSRQSFHLWRKGILIFILGVVVISPWIFNLFLTAHGSPMFREIVATKFNLAFLSRTPGSIAFFSLKRLEDSLSFYSTKWITGLALLGIILGVWQKNKLILTLLLWIALLFAWCNPRWIRVPFSGFVDIKSLILSLYFPASIFVSYFIVHSSKRIRLPSRSRNIATVSLLICISLLCIRPMLTVVKKDRGYVTETDKVAMEWITKNTAEETKFLISSCEIPSEPYGQTGLTGRDAGYWIPYFTKRATTIPLLVHDFEKTIPEDAWKSACQIASMTSQNSASAETIRFLKKNGVTHVYIGEKSNWQPVEQSPFSKSRFFQEEYRLDRVRIFKIKYEELSTDEEEK